MNDIMTKVKKKHAKTWPEFVHLVEKQLDGEALYSKYNEKTMAFDIVPWKDNQDEVYNVYVKGYNVADMGVKILANKLTTTKYKNVLALPDGKTFYGFSHRGGSLVSVGDKIFDENYVFNKEEAKPYLDKAKKAMQEDPSWYKGMTIDEVVMGFVPYRQRGKEIADTVEKALESAKNIGDSLS